MKNVTIAAGMMQSMVGDAEGNLERVDRLASDAAGRGAGFLLLPEACLSGYTVRQDPRPLAETVPGPLTKAAVDIARSRGVFICAGLVEAADGDCYLTQFIAGPEGLAGSYRKTHLGPTEEELFTPGDRLAVIEAGGVRYGLLLCYEGHFPEISRSLVLAGADVLLAAHASPRENPADKEERWRRYLPARAYDASAYLVAVNAAGDNGDGLTFAGVGLIAGPKGEIIAGAAGWGEGLVAAELRAGELETVRNSRMGYFLGRRRPDLYIS